MGANRLNMPKILLIRFSSIGDIVLTSPIIRALKLQLDAELHFLCKRSFASLLDHHPHISKVYSLDESFQDLIRQLKTESYDYVVDLHKNLRSRRVCQSLGLPAYRFDKLNWQKWLLVNFKIDKMPALHLVDRYFDGLAALPLKNDGQGLDFYLPQSIEDPAYRAFDQWSIDKPFICLALGAAHATKQMPLSLLEPLIAQSRHPLALLGGPKEAALGAQLAEKFGDKVHHLAGKISLIASGKVLSKSLALISPDTGMMHIGAALKIPVVAVWGNTVPEFGMYPYYPAGAAKFENIETEGLSCRPCSKIGKKTCPKGHFNCMKMISPARVLEATERLLA